MDKNKKYYCLYCDWVGTEENAVQLAGDLWDYSFYDCCPVCWEKDRIKSMLLSKGEKEWLIQYKKS